MCGIRTPSEAQTAAHEEAKGAATEARALWQQKKAERKKELLEKARPLAIAATASAGALVPAVAGDPSVAPGDRSALSRAHVLAR